MRRKDTEEVGAARVGSATHRSLLQRNDIIVVDAKPRRFSPCAQCRLGNNALGGDRPLGFKGFAYGFV